MATKEPTGTNDAPKSGKTTYDPKAVEERRGKSWLEADLFKADPSRPGASYSIVIPPPNVTGSLHMGHALNVTLQDILIRYGRMNGMNALWVPGTDHAGIATQNVVEKELKKERKTKEDLGREAFLERVWAWKAESGGTILNQLKRLGASCDWSRERFTMDAGLSRAVREAFVRLYRKGLIYRGKYMINWCPRCLTALSDLEVEYETKPGTLWHIRYPELDGHRSIIVATTRPETMLGDTAVAVNPQDRRYADRIGMTLRLPLMDRPIPLIADEMVDLDFGTGAVKITPSHDPADFETAKRHQLPHVRVIDDSGRMTLEAGDFAGMTREEARAKVVGRLKEEGLLVEETAHSHNVGHCYRCQTVTEPSESVQWFVRTGPLAERAIEAVRSGETKIVPVAWEENYFQWLTNIRDWCISRQIWWGHRIPAWHCAACGQTTVDTVDPSACPSCGSKELRQENDVLDTWFSSALWPFSTLGWPDETPDLARYYPTAALVTGYDILFFWVARMMMMGLEFTDKAPFATVVIHPLVYDEKGKKMSKSRGNVIDPLLMIDRYGADAFRFTLMASTFQPSQGIGIRMGEKSPEKYREFMNKIYQAGRFVALHVGGGDVSSELPEKMDAVGCWIVSRLQRAVDEVRQGIETHRFKEAAIAFMRFFWDEFCDWYLEMAKPALYGECEDTKAAERAVLRYVYREILRLGHPFIPFITEELACELDGKESFLLDAPYPVADPGRMDVDVEERVGRLIEVVTAIRNIRGELGVSAGRKIEARLKGSHDALSFLSSHETIVSTLARVETVRYEDDSYIPVDDATAVVGDVEVCVPIRGIVDDFAKETTRLTKEVERAKGEMASIDANLANEQFVARASADIIEARMARKVELEEKIQKLSRNLELLERMTS